MTKIASIFLYGFAVVSALLIMLYIAVTLMTEPPKPQVPTTFVYYVTCDNGWATVPKDDPTHVTLVNNVVTIRGKLGIEYIYQLDQKLKCQYVAEAQEIKNAVHK